MIFINEYSAVFNTVYKNNARVSLLIYYFKIKQFFIELFTKYSVDRIRNNYYFSFWLSISDV